MAVNILELGSRFQLRLNMGFDGDGHPIIRSRTYSSVKHDAGDETVFGVAKGLAGLQDNVLEAVHRINEVILVEG